MSPIHLLNDQASFVDFRIDSRENYGRILELDYTQVEEAIRGLESFDSERLGVKIKNFTFVHLAPGSTLDINPKNFQMAAWDLDETAIDGSAEAVHDGINGRFSRGTRNALLSRGLEFSDAKWEEIWNARLRPCTGVAEAKVVEAFVNVLNNILIDDTLISGNGNVTRTKNDFRDINFEELNQLIEAALYEIADEKFAGVMPTQDLERVLMEFREYSIKNVLLTASGDKFVELLERVSINSKDNRFGFFQHFDAIAAGVQKLSFEGQGKFDNYITNVCRQMGIPIGLTMKIGDSISDLAPYVMAGGQNFILRFNSQDPEQLINKSISLTQQLDQAIYKANGMTQEAKIEVDQEVRIYVAPDFQKIRVVA